MATMDKELREYASVEYTLTFYSLNGKGIVLWNNRHGKQ